MKRCRHCGGEIRLFYIGEWPGQWVHDQGFRYTVAHPAIHIAEPITVEEMIDDLLRIAGAP